MFSLILEREEGGRERDQESRRKKDGRKEEETEMNIHVREKHR